MSVRLFFVKEDEDGVVIERKQILAGSVTVVEAGMRAAEDAAREAARRAAKGG
jgi:hypothetical protein